MDISGKVWVDSALNSGVGGVDATVTLTAGAAPEVYSDLTGRTTLTAPSTTVTHDSGVGAQTTWGCVMWTALTSLDSMLTVQVRSSSDDMTYLAWQMVTSLMDLSVPDGRYLQVWVTFWRSTTTGETSILYDLSIGSVVFWNKNKTNNAKWQKDNVRQSTTLWLMFLDFWSGMQSIREALLSKR